MSHPCQSSAHPQVPVSTIMVFARWCHACGEWSVTSSAQTQIGSDLEVVTPYAETTFGPFDDLLVVEDEMQRHVAGIMLTPGRPWDQGSWG